MKLIGITAAVVVLICLGVGFAINGLPGSHSSKPQYWVELDTAFGLEKGGDMKIVGVRAGKITDIDLDRRNLHARVQFQINQQGFGRLPKDTFCESRPQSVIGEYYLDCHPGTSRKLLRNGATIPVTQTQSTVGPDLINDVMRMPQRQGLRLIIAELGAGVAGNAQSLNEAIRRGAPALRETDQVLNILANQNRVITDLNVNADTVLKALADNRAEVARWVVKARNLSADSAQRRADIAAGWHKLPFFLEQLRPTMRALGMASDAERPALISLDRSAGQLKELFKLLGPFSNVSRPAIRALGDASRVGIRAVRDATPTVRLLNGFSTGLPELGRNLAIILEHLDNRKYAVENDVRAAQQQGVSGPSGYSGLEALLQYTMDQTTSINIFNKDSHVLNVTPFDSNCANYSDAQQVQTDPSLAKCLARLGPNAPGINFYDPTAAGLGPYPSSSPSSPLPLALRRAATRSSGGKGTVAMPSLDKVLPGVPPQAAPPVNPQAVAPNANPSPTTQAKVLDYLLGR